MNRIELTIGSAFLLMMVTASAEAQERPLVADADQPYQSKWQPAEERPEPLPCRIPIISERTGKVLYYNVRLDCREPIPEDGKTYTPPPRTEQPPEECKPPKKDRPKKDKPKGKKKDKRKDNASEHNGKGGNDGKGGKDRDGSKNSDKGKGGKKNR